MTGPIADRLRTFTARLLERRGAEVDWPSGAEEGLALLPAGVARALHCLEILPLAAHPANALPINLTSDFLERVDPLIAAEPRIVTAQIPEAYLKRADMAAPVARAFNWLNARVRVQAAEPTRAEYHTWYFLATFDSADRWQQVVRVTVNATTHAEVQLPDLSELDVVLCEPREAQREPATLLAAARAALTHVQADSRAFVERLESRLARDRQRLQDYYRALLRGDDRRAARRPVVPEPTQQAAKVKAVQLELRRKLAELDERYECRLELSPLALVRTDSPALAVRCQVLRRTTAGAITVFWNPATKDLEPLCCSRCGVSTFSLAFSDDKLAALCKSCQH